MIHVEHLTRRFHDLVAVDDLSLEVPEGEVLGFLGPNGAGKSTTIRILTGFLPATSGRATVGGHDVSRDSLAARRLLGYLPENVPLPPDARVDEYLEYRARLKGLGSARRKERRQAVLEQCGLQSMRRRILSQLSRGYRQRVGLADALLAEPRVLILDEPTGGLDPRQRQEVLELVAGLAGRCTVMLSSHVLNEVESICTRLAIIARGRIVGQGSLAQLKAEAGREGEVALETVPGGGPALVATCLERGLELVDDGGDSIVVRQPEGAEPAELLAALVGAGHALRRFQPLTRSLQQIFLDLTRT